VWQDQGAAARGVKHRALCKGACVRRARCVAPPCHILLRAWRRPVQTREKYAAEIANMHVAAPTAATLVRAASEGAPGAACRVMGFVVVMLTPHWCARASCG
jgi:hypothetical protein